MKSSLSNRILKNHKKFAKQFSKNNIEAFRLYDRDIPEAQVIVDIYNDHVVIFERFHDKKDSPEKQEEIREDLRACLGELGFKSDKIIFKMCLVKLPFQPHATCQNRM